MAPHITAADPKPNAIVPTLASQQPTRAYVTFLPTGGDDVKGIVGLAKGLRKVKSKYQLVVAVVLPDVPEEDRKILKEQGCIVREIKPVYLPESQTQFAMGYHAINFAKLRIWGFVEYSKMIYLNGNIQVYGNIDRLFDLPAGRLHAVMDCFCEKTWSHTQQYKISYCQQRSDRWPEAKHGPCPAPYFNAGMFVFEPSLPTYQNLLKTLMVTPLTPFAEQDFLNMYFRKIYQPIDQPLYNLVLPMLWRHPEKIGLDNVRAAGSKQWGCNRMEKNMDREYMMKWFDKVKVVQYCAPVSKPWRYNPEGENMDRKDIIKMLVDEWFEIYDNGSLDYKNCADPVA